MREQQLLLRRAKQTPWFWLFVASIASKNWPSFIPSSRRILAYNSRPAPENSSAALCSIARLRRAHAAPLSKAKSASSAKWGWSAATTNLSSQRSTSTRVRNDSGHARNAGVARTPTRTRRRVRAPEGNCGRESGGAEPAGLLQHRVPAPDVYPGRSQPPFAVDTNLLGRTSGFFSSLGSTLGGVLPAMFP
jgi:hypothetical protein